VSEPWQHLSPGDRFCIDSRSGNGYKATFLAAATHPDGGLFLRFAPDKLGRFDPEKLDWRTLERLPACDPVAPGDDVVVTLRGGVERRGRVVAASDGHLSLRLASGPVLVVAKEQMHGGCVRLLFAASDWQRGDAFMVTSRSGREYRGTTLSVGAERVDVLLEGPGGVPAHDAVSLRIAQLDLRTLRVLVPVRPASLAPA
jgi:hypothetical protein